MGSSEYLNKLQTEESKITSTDTCDNMANLEDSNDPQENMMAQPRANQNMNENQNELCCQCKNLGCDCSITRKQFNCILVLLLICITSIVITVLTENNCNDNTDSNTTTLAPTQSPTPVSTQSPTQKPNQELYLGPCWTIIMTLIMCIIAKQY